MQLTVLGSGPACPRPGGASSGYLLASSVGSVLVDCGHGTIGPLRAGTSLRDLKGIVISHMHPDHYWELVALKYGLLWAGIHDLPLYLPPGGLPFLDRLQDAVLDSDHFFSDVFAPAEYDPSALLRLGGLDIRFVRTTHPMPAWAMRFADPADGGRALVYTSDTGRSDDVPRLAHGAALLLCEATYVDDDETAARFGHLTARQAGELARAAGAERLLLAHYGSETAAELVPAAQHAFHGPVELAEEGRTYVV